MNDFLQILDEAIEDGTFLSCVLSKPRTPSEQNAGRAEKITIRPVTVKGRSRYQWAIRTGPKESHENHSAEETRARLQQLFGKEFDDLHLFTVDADYSARFDGRGELRVHQSRASQKRPATTTHNRAKEYLIPEGTPCPFLAEIGVMTPEGEVRKSKYAKFRQVNRFLELVNDVVGSLPQEGTLHVVDFGCGKSSLTFALHHLLTKIHGRSVRILGLDRNRDVIETCRRTAAQLQLDGIEFQVGDIATCSVDFRVDLAVSLHACDTATDDAVARAVSWESRVILAVPCCQHELSKKIRPEHFEAIAGHGILKERLAEIATDALRATALEIVGYKVQVVEFIEMEHTPKNLLIRAVHRSGHFDPSAKRAEYLQLKDALGLDRIHLEDALGPAFSEQLNGTTTAP
ncbi:MAG: SAM-dependent methyltransferase [Planctomycetaceae bacterium]